MKKNKKMIQDEECAILLNIEAMRLSPLSIFVSI